MFHKQQSYFSQIVSKKKAKIAILFFMKNSKNDNIILVFSFLYLVSVYPTNRTCVLSYDVDWRKSPNEMKKSINTFQEFSDPRTFINPEFAYLAS